MLYLLGQVLSVQGDPLHLFENGGAHTLGVLVFLVAKEADDHVLIEYEEGLLVLCLLVDGFLLVVGGLDGEDAGLDVVVRLYGVLEVVRPGASLCPRSNGLDECLITNLLCKDNLIEFLLIEDLEFDNPLDW